MLPDGRVVSPDLDSRTTLVTTAAAPTPMAVQNHHLCVSGVSAGGAVLWITAALGAFAPFSAPVGSCQEFLLGGGRAASRIGNQPASHSDGG